MLRAGIRRRSLPSKTGLQMLTCFVPRRRAGDQPSGSISPRVIASRGTQMPGLRLPVQAEFLHMAEPVRNCLPIEDELIDNRADGKTPAKQIAHPGAPWCLCKTIHIL